LNCQHGPTPTPCNKCEFCLSINEDRSIDVLEIDGASNRGVEEISPIRDTGKYKPLHSRFKIIIIDEVHMLSTHAFNALLKTLEEPPPSTIFIFATTEFHKVPATIISRCQHFEFKKVSQKDIINHLMDICKKESLTISPYGLGLIAEASDGSIRDAQSLLDQAVAFCGENIGDQELKEILGTVSQDLLFEFSSAVFEEKPQAVFSLVEKVIESGHDLRFFYKELVEHFRNLLLIASVENAQDLLAFNPEELKRLKEESQKASPEDFLRCLQALQQAEPGMRYSSHPQIYFEALLVRLCHFKKIVLLKDLLQEMEKIKKEGAGSAESLPRTSWPSRPPIKAQEEAETRPRPSVPVETEPPAAPSRTPFEKPKEEPAKQEREMDIALKDPTVKMFMTTFKARVLSVEPVKGKAKEEED
jgi:DNA polymerase-3 subunit gamma/tau